MFKVIIAGGRDFNDYTLLEEKCKKILKTKADDGLVIVSGKARGADMLGEEFATKFGIPIEYYPAQWETDGRRAGFLRNEEMASKANALIAFWDGKSKGTQHMIEVAKKRELLVRVINY